MKALRAYVTCLILALFMTAFPSLLKAETVYVSTSAGQQILAFSDAGAVMGVCNMTFNGTGVSPEDVVVGPDGQLYVADPAGSRIFRVNPGNVTAPASPAGDCGAVAVYDQSNVATVCTDSANSKIACPTGPEGPSFLRINTLDLYFNTHGTGTGIWKIPGIANSGNNATCSTTTAPPCPDPVQVLSAATSGEGSGEGLDFDVFGDLLAVDQTNGNVIRESVSCFNGTNAGGQPCFSDLITGLSAPVGVAVNTCGDTLVASGKTVRRYTGSALQDSITFSGNNLPRFLEVDSMNRIFVVTAADETGKGGTLWRFDPPNSSLTLCGLKSFTTGLNIAISKSLATGIATSNGLGLGVSASNVSVAGSFVPNKTSSNTFNFGSHSFAITCNGVLQPFTLTVTAVKSMPTDSPNPEVNFNGQLPANPPLCPVALPNPQCVHYGGQHGFCTQYIETATDSLGLAITDANLPNFCSAAPHAFTFQPTYQTPEPMFSPGGAHADTDNQANPVTEPYSECQSQDFYTDCCSGRYVGTNSKHVVFNAALLTQGTITLNSPISSCSSTGGVTTCNPQFNIGQNINVKFDLLQGGTPITTATEQLSIARTSHTTKGKLVTEFIPQTVVATKNSATLNFFVPNSSGQYSYNADSSVFDNLPKGSTATYQFTIWGNGAQPFSFFTTGTF